MNSVTLERMTIGAQQYISSRLLNDFGMRPTVRIEQVAYEQLALQVRQYVYSQQLDQSTVRYPATWRDAVKERLYAWLRSGHWPWGADLLEPHYPVEWRDVTIDVHALYPKIAMPHERHSIHVAQMSDTTTESTRLWFDAKGCGFMDMLYQLYYEGRTGRTWHVSRPIYYELAKMREPNGDYLFSPSQTEQTVFGMKVIIDRDMPRDTIELRDNDDQVVGKIYNIG